MTETAPAETARIAAAAAAQFARVTPGELVCREQFEIAASADEQGEPQVLVTCVSPDSLKRVLPSVVRKVDLYEGPGEMRTVKVAFRVPAVSSKQPIVVKPQ